MEKKQKKILLILSVFSSMLMVKPLHSLFTMKLTKTDYDFAIQNKLQEGYIYDITIQNNEIKDATLVDTKANSFVFGTVSEVNKNFIKVQAKKISITKNTKFYKINWKASASKVEKVQAKQLKNQTVKITLDAKNRANNIYIIPISKAYTSPVTPVAGTKTFKKFLTTALQPVGTFVYVYGGGWDWQDEASSPQATSIGIPSSWIDFYQFQNPKKKMEMQRKNTQKQATILMALGINTTMQMQTAQAM